MSIAAAAETRMEVNTVPAAEDGVAAENHVAKGGVTGSGEQSAGGEAQGASSGVEQPYQGKVSVIRWCGPSEFYPLCHVHRSKTF